MTIFLVEYFFTYSFSFLGLVYLVKCVFSFSRKRFTSWLQHSLFDKMSLICRKRLCTKSSDANYYKSCIRNHINLSKIESVQLTVCTTPKVHYTALQNERKGGTIHLYKKSHDPEWNWMCSSNSVRGVVRIPAGLHCLRNWKEVTYPQQ